MGLNQAPSLGRHLCSVRNNAHLIFHINASVPRLEAIQQIQWGWGWGGKGFLWIFNLGILCKHSSPNNRTAVFSNESLGWRTESTEVEKVVGGKFGLNVLLPVPSR